MAQKGWTNINFGSVDFKNEKPANCCKNSCNCKHCAKTILIIGGMTKFKQLYKNLIESCGHECEYLDGYMKGGEKILERKIMKCDMVFCPVDCNSHNACASAKKFCRKHCKPITILTSSGITNMAQAVKNINI
ncbi:hypothetical protein Dtox_1661 [Desulfofarcimen acetoxidans DSM 771]|jgi:hypothetical protein|uniref:DUF2325 domain-containing protein n=1 Tax=Desulfofarcimen acetoxidans (strain ATCC 49208 / DSM 771 / KCTC 5769 / VKM B-1644 / 5575) TaxID=485916 RepID=C8VWG6_DESAS|nr:DUF2325 domain-containing protein [Desulfofarcimen acetoxidans]ACV62518.1 hypothetical protein Dtox_1661 [Desulfofarcimen acetoxidans DSM 771]